MNATMLHYFIVNYLLFFCREIFLSARKYEEKENIKEQNETMSLKRK